MTLTRKQQGFTIVELLIVIIVIGILATLVLVTFSGIQQSARNTQRQTDIKAVASHLETYNAKNAFYPTADDLNNVTAQDPLVAGDTWVAENLKGLDRESTRDPKGTVYTFAGAATSNQYGYAVTPSGCDNTAGNECTGFSLTYIEEGTGDTKTVNNL